MKSLENFRARDAGFAPASHGHPRSAIPDFAHGNGEHNTEYTVQGHSHSRANITDFSHGHPRSAIANFKHDNSEHSTAYTDFGHTHPGHKHDRADITNFEHGSGEHV